MEENVSLSAVHQSPVSLLLPVVTLLAALVYLVHWRTHKKNAGPASSKPLPPNPPYGFSGLLRAAMNPQTNFVRMAADMVHTGPLHLFQYNWPTKFRILFINDFEMGKELFQKTVFSARPENEHWRYHAKGNYGLVTSCGTVWDEQRRFTLRLLKNMGMGNSKSMETLISTEVEDFIHALELVEGQVISPNHMTSIPFFNTLWVLLTGERFNHGQNPLSKMLLGIYEGFMKIFGIPQVFLILTHETPVSVERSKVIRRWLPFGTPLDTVQAGFDNLRSFCVDFIEERRQLVKKNSSDAPQSFIDEYIKEIEETTDTKSTFYMDEGVMNLQATVADLFIASGETSANTLSWAMLHLIRNPKVQAEMVAEIDTVVGRERYPTLSDRPNLPLCEAFLWEVLRLTPASLFSLPHMTTEDTEVGPYLVEKHTTVFLNIAAIHMDPKLWDDPYDFKPKRFINSEGKFVKNPAMVAFSIGKRKCPATTLALDNLFLFVSSICQKFVLKKDPKLGEDEFPPLLSELSGLNAPKPFSMVLETRKHL